MSIASQSEAFPTLDDRRFTGVRRLYGEAGFVRLREAHVVIIGLGGVGSWAAESLARSGVGALTLIDEDIVAESNLNRQAHATLEALGANKVDAMRARILSFAPDCRVQVVDQFISTENLNELIPKNADLIIDAIDKVQSKAGLVAHCVHIQMPIIVCGSAGGKTDAAKLTHNDLARTEQDALLAKLREILRRQYRFPRGDEKIHIPAVFSPEFRALAAEGDTDGGAGLACAGYGSAMHITAGMGLIAAGLALARLTSGDNPASTVKLLKPKAERQGAAHAEPLS